jgi:hypothetical protein
VTPPDTEPAAPVVAVASAPAGGDTLPKAGGGDSLAGGGAGQGGGTGGGTGGGVGPGTGAGAGPGTGGGGAGGQGRGPEPRHLILPPEDPPKELRGIDIKVTFWIDPTGKVVRVAFEPPVRDRKFATKLTEAMRNYRFHPAVGPDGTPIAATYTHTLTY